MEKPQKVVLKKKKAPFSVTINMIKGTHESKVNTTFLHLGSSSDWQILFTLTRVMLRPNLSFYEKTVDPDQLASEGVI